MHCSGHANLADVDVNVNLEKARKYLLHRYFILPYGNIVIASINIYMI